MIKYQGNTNRSLVDNVGRTNILRYSVNLLVNLENPQQGIYDNRNQVF